VMQLQSQARHHEATLSPTLAAMPGSMRAAIALQSEWKPDDAPMSVARRLREAKDKRAFFDRAITIGGGAHLQMARQAIDACQPVRQAGMVGAEQRFVMQIRSDDPMYHRRLDAFRALFASCEGFERRPVTIDEWKSLEQRRAELRDVTATAIALQRRELEPAEARRVARTLLETGDAWLIGNVSTYLMQERLSAIRLANLGDELAREINREQHAWLWAVCELGSDCGPDSYIGKADCALRGLCDGGAPDERLRELKDQILAAIRSRDWAKLGL
jgi:hypothetical protein